MHPNASAAPLNAVAAPVGPLDWRRVVGWLREDGVISPEEAERTIARCAQAESHQHPLVRLANVAMERAADARALDLEELTQYVAGRCGLRYLRIDPLKVDVGRVADAMSASYAERHRVLPVQVTPHEVVVATAEPFITDWVAEVERQSKLSVRRAGVLSRHLHPNPVHGFVLKGKWFYREHDWVATEGSYVFEPPGEIHTLVVDEGV